MPPSSRAQQKAEAKYNVTTDFPRYDLHYAAASGNLGLVKFALSHGQPVNSVLNGVLPLHAACAGGNEVVIKYLIDAGADVNGPRIPRRYSNDRHRTSGLAVGASGSTPLHFAAANGHLPAVHILLSHGANPSTADKHGITPAMLARENGWVECADLLDQASDYFGQNSANGAEDDIFREESDEGHSSRAHEALEAVQHVFQSAGTKRLQVKRSIDNAINLLKPLHSQSHSPSNHQRNAGNTTGTHLYHHSSFQHLRSTPTSSNTSSPMPMPLGEYTFYPTSSNAGQQSPPAHNEQRRPSLPHIFGSTPTPNMTANTGPPKRRASGSGKCRPRSAGTDSDQQQRPTGGNTSTPSHHTPRRLGSKISLLHLFKRSNGGGSADTSSVEDGATGSSPVPFNRPPKISTSGISSGVSASPSSQSPSPSPSTRVPMAVDLHHQLSRERFERSRLREEATSSPVFVDDDERDNNESSSFVIKRATSATATPPSRPSILKTHQRSSSSQSSATDFAPTTARSLRFDASASPSPAASYYSTPASSSTHVQASTSKFNLRTSPGGSKLRASRSVNSIGSRDSARMAGIPIETVDPMDASPMVQPPSDSPESAPAKVLTFRDASGRVPYESARSTGRARGPSFASSTSTSSGLPSPPSVEDGGTGTDGERYNRREFPFSIASPPVNVSNILNKVNGAGEEADEDGIGENEENDTITVDGTYTLAASDGRARGRSVSSTETDGSAPVDLSYSPSTLSGPTNLTTPTESSPGYNDEGSVYGPREDQRIGTLASPASSMEDLGEPIPPSRSILRSISHSNHVSRQLSNISNYAEAKDLALRAEQEIVRTASLGEDEPDATRSLEAQLAAYGEILALERRFARGERQRQQWGNRTDSEDEGEGRESNNNVVSRVEDSGRRGSSPKMTRAPASAPVAQRRGKAENGTARRLDSSGAQNTSVTEEIETASRRRRGTRNSPKIRRPHTSEGATRVDWGTATGRNATKDRGEGVNRSELDQTLSKLSPLRTESNDLQESTPSIEIIETVPTPVDSPRTPDMVEPAATRKSLDERGPRENQQYGSDIHGAVYAFQGSPLIRVSTEPVVDDKYEFDFESDELINTRRSNNASKLAKMGFSPETSIRPSTLTYNSSARSPPKARFGGIKSFVQTLKGR